MVDLHCSAGLQAHGQKSLLWAAGVVLVATLFLVVLRAGQEQLTQAHTRRRRHCLRSRHLRTRRVLFVRSTLVLAPSQVVAAPRTLPGYQTARELQPPSLLERLQVLACLAAAAAAGTVAAQAAATPDRAVVGALTQQISSARGERTPFLVKFLIQPEAHAQPTLLGLSPAQARQAFLALPANLESFSP